MKPCPRCGEPVKGDRGKGPYCQPCGTSIANRKRGIGRTYYTSSAGGSKSHHRRAKPKPVTLPSVSLTEA